MNSFIENVNYVANLDNKYGSGIELYKNNLSLKSVQHDIELKFSYYNNDDKKIHSIVHLEPGVLVGGIDDTLLSFKTLVESSITGSEFTCTVSSVVQNFVINNIVMVNIAIDSNNNTYKAYELEMKVITAGATTYDVFGEVKDSLKILPSLAMITASDIDVIANVYEIQEDVITVASNIVGLNSIVSNMPEILLADDNAAIATTKALESSDSAAASLQSSLDSAASAALLPNHIDDTTNPHEVTKIQVGLEFAENTADIDKVVASAGKLTAAVNISLSGDVNGSVSFDGSGDADIVVSIYNDSHIHSDATTSVSGFMSTSDKIKLDAIAPGSNNYVHPSTHDASIITTTDEFSNSDSTNVQDVLDDLDYAIDVEKGRIDAILIGSGANADTFAEVVTLVNSIDTTNDQAFAGYVLNNDARSATIEGDISALESNKADKATTLTRYGITDAYTKTEVQTILPKVGFDTTNVVVPGIGQVAWNQDENTLDLGLNGAVLQVGQEHLIRVRNNTVSTITNGSAVMATGTIGNSGRITIGNANLTQTNAKYILGIVTENIISGADGFVTAFGKVRGIQTNGGQFGETWADGDVIYVKDSGSGALTKIAPTDTQVKLPIAIVVHAHGSNGTLFVRVNSIDENHAKAELALKADKSDTYTKGQVDTALALKVDDAEIASVNLLRADKYLAAQNIAAMMYTAGDLTKIQYNNATDVNYEVLNYTSGNLSSINHYTTSVLRGTTTLSYTSGNLVSAIFVGV